MKKIEVHNRCSDYDSYRAARVKSLFNAESGCNFDLEAELPADETTWRIGVIVGPSGSGKSSIGRQFWPDVPIADLSAGWLSDTVDGGPVAAQDWCFVRPDDDAHSLWRRELFPMGVRLLRRALSDILRGDLVMHDQDPSLATWEPSVTGAPRLYRPELPQLGTLPDGYEVIK